MPIERSTIRMLRHGQSTGNTGELFQGGGADVLLTPLGERQSYAAGIIARVLGIYLRLATPSNKARARDTALQFVGGYGEPMAVADQPLADFYEIDHGDELAFRVTREEAAARRRDVVRRATELLLRAGMDEHLTEYVPWVIPTGSGNGEPYLAAAIRCVRAIEAHRPASDEVLVGHNGAMRQARALAMHVLPAGRREMYARYRDISSLAAAGAETLADTVVRDAPAIISMVGFLAGSGLPALDYVNAPAKRIGNAELVEVEIADGMWTPVRRVRPHVPDDSSVPLTADTVSYEVRPFTSAESWL